MQTKPIISRVIATFKKNFHAMPSVGIEQEFYLHGDVTQVQKVSAQIEKALPSLTQERGWQQYEYCTDHSTDLLKVAQNVYANMSLIKQISAEEGVIAQFDPKPHPEDYGSAMQVNMSLQNEYGANLYSDYEIQDNNKLQQSIAGILDLMDETFCLICKSEESFLRFVSDFHAPINKSWGGNNRTTALRIPNSDVKNRRIECRIAPSDADPCVAILCVLLGVYHGLKNKLEPQERTYGDASHPQYNLETFPQNIEDAQSVYDKKGILKSYIKDFKPFF